jgi:putative ABC transport system permease protein
MFKNYIKTAWRNIKSSRLYSSLNILGLATGMAVALMIGLWIYDEVSFNRNFSHYDRIAQVMVNTDNGNGIYTGRTTSIPMGVELQNKYGADFRHVALATHQGEHIISTGEKKIAQTGMWVQPAFPKMFTLKMLTGSIDGLQDPSSVLLSQSVATALFKDIDPLNQVVRIDNKTELKVTGVFENFPGNSSFREVTMLLPWEKAIIQEEWMINAQTQWDNHMCQLFVQLQDQADVKSVSNKIKNIPTPHIKTSKEELLLHPMSRWHLYNEFNNGYNVGGRIQLIWLFGTIGLFVLLLACINFMNLSTARSGKRSREVGIRKTMGSLRAQLITQFLGESVTLATLSLVLALLLVQFSLPVFNSLSDKSITIPWQNPMLWLIVLGFTFVTGIIAGSYPAFYLSSFNPVKVLKGTWKAGPYASLPRKVLIVVQFTISVMLIIGTFIVYRQIQHAGNRPVGYTREGLITINMNTPELRGHYDAIRLALLQTGVVANMAQSNSAPTSVWSNNVVEWKGKDPNIVYSPGTIAVTHDFGQTVGWSVIEGRDFSRNYPTDTFSFILNEAAVKMTGFKEPVGQTIRWLGQEHTIVGVIKDMVMESPYEPVRPTIFHLNPDWVNIITIRVKPDAPMQSALSEIETVFKKFNPGSPFAYKFVDEEYAKKFANEKRVGDLTTIFAILAIFISCLGLFGLASFMAEQSIKEIGIRKVLGASVYNLWQMQSKDFVKLVLIACAIAIPAAWLSLNQWLQQYQYRTEISWWILPITTLGVLMITLCTVTYHALSAAITNPVKSLKAD